MESTAPQVILTLPDMCCAGCVATVNQTLTGLDGILRSEADPESHQVELEFDPQRVSLATIESTLGAAGYPVQGDSHEPSQL